MIGLRIKLARKKMGLSLRGLSDAIGGKVSAQALGKYERDEMVPSSGVLIAVGRALGVSLSYLMSAQAVELTGVDFRAKANTRVKDRAHVETAVIEWIERYLEIERVLELDSMEWETPSHMPSRLNAIHEAEALADGVRDMWKIGLDPIPNMTELLEEKGLKVLIEDLPAKVSGFTCLVNRRDNSDVPIVVINRSFSLERRRMTLAHELAHRVINPEALSERDEEKAANYFAGAFLMPREHLQNEVGKHRNRLGHKEIMDLKKLYRVSGAALLVRLRDIGVITDSVLTYAFQSIAVNWRTQEPEELENNRYRGEQEKPQKFERLCYRALAEGLISVAKASELLRCPIEEVEIGLKGPL